MGDFLLEIGTEEIPARFIEPAKEGLLRSLSDGLTQARISFGNIYIQGTPRRLAVIIDNMADKQEETKIIKFGPPANRAYDETGSPTKAAIGFAKSQNVAVEDLKKAVKDGIEFVTVEKIEKGMPTTTVLPDLLKDVISKIPFQKKMRWGGESFEYARPIQWLLVLFDSMPVDVEIADVKSSNYTYCHRFLSKGPIEIKNAQEYRDRLRQNYVIIDESERMGIILKGIEDIEKRVGGIAIRDEDLLKEILYITEYPYPLAGTFDRSFLKIPKEVLINVMKSHQKYIPIENPEGDLMPFFIFFANTVPVSDSNVIKGNEKVLRARLADAGFFFEEDKKITLSSLYERLSSIVFHVRLGTLKEKTDRVAEIADYLARILNYNETESLKKVARIIKADLLTHMVGEFPELQGTMGRIYAGLQGYEPDEATAIEEHYLPTGGDGDLPKTQLGSILGIADKIDSLVAFFSVGITPSGNLDPYALRRQALGVIRIITDKRYNISLSELIRCAYDVGSGIKDKLSFEDTKASLVEFIQTRFKFSMIEEGHRQDFVESVLDVVGNDIYDGYERLLSLENQSAIEDFEKLMVGFKRVYNITKQIFDSMQIDTSLFRQDEERSLYLLYDAKKDEFFNYIEKRQYAQALTVLISFKSDIDSFFDKVFVMDKEESIKNNRLALLKHIKDMFLTYSDFSKIRIE
ncbi:MAG: glycine--tRNA ligase subunit beta [Syntrophorhabdaceae bacterium]|nr:glycine--tRNA ligase subunit beta [Syntrophorhabdaceae bacterium]